MTNILDDEMERFGRDLITLVRDPALREIDGLIAGRYKSRAGRRWATLASDETVRAALTELVPDVVDQVMFQLMDMVDNAELPWLWPCQDGEVRPMSQIGGGELAGWSAGGDTGWLGQYATERYNDYLSSD